MGELCSTPRGDEKCVQNFSLKIREEESISEIYCKLKTGFEGTGSNIVNWIKVAQDRTFVFRTRRGMY
jgi:hypothetical protein